MAPKVCPAAQSHGQREDAHVLHARIGQHALEIALRDDEKGRYGHGKQAEAKQNCLPELSQPGRHAHLLDSEHRQEGAVEQSPGKQRGNHGRRFAVRVGKPGMHGGKPQLGAVAYQQEKKGRLEPRRVKETGHLDQARSKAAGRGFPAPSVDATARKKLPRSARAIPTEQIMRYFQVASRERRCRWK